MSTQPQLRRVLNFAISSSITSSRIQPALGRRGGGRAELALIWLIAALGFSCRWSSASSSCRRATREERIYVWSKRAFGLFAAFITGWTYWGSNLPYLPGLLHTPPPTRSSGRAGVSVVVGQQHLFPRDLTAGLAIAVAMNVVGLNVGKWLSNVGAIAG